MLRFDASCAWFSLCTALLGTTAGCVQDQSVAAAARQTASVTRAERPASFPSEWDAKNWQARESAIAKEGLVEVQLTRTAVSAAPKVTVEQGAWCQFVGSPDHDGRRFFFSLSGEFGMSADGTLHCLKIDMPALGNKDVEIDGPPPYCTGGAFQPTVPVSLLYEVPPGVKVGAVKQLSVPSYNVAHRYKESCPPLP